MAAGQSDDALDRRRRIRELALLFLRLGTTAFGGPAAHIAIMEDEVVRRRGWMTHPEFLDLLGATNLIPGPNSTEMAIHIGHRRAGWAGLVVAGACFILPAGLMVTAMAWAYVRYGDLPDAEGVLYGVKPVVIAVVLQALWSLGRTAVKSTGLGLLAALAALASLLGANELAVLFVCGTVAGVAASGGRPPANEPAEGGRTACGVSPVVAAAAMSGAPAGAVAFGMWPMFLFFVKVGSVLFGSGYVLLAFLRGDLVERWQWLTEQQLLDAIAVGQVTPGPVFTTATFVGYLLGGGTGALVATVGIFLPAFVFVALSGPLVPRIRRSPTAGAVLDGVNVASLALMAVVTWQLGRVALMDLLTVALAGASALLLLKWRVNSFWLILGGAVIGVLAGGRA